MYYAKVDLTHKIIPNEKIKIAEGSVILKIHSSDIVNVIAYMDIDCSPVIITTGVEDSLLKIATLGIEDTVTVDVSGYKYISFSTAIDEEKTGDYVYMITEV